MALILKLPLSALLSFPVVTPWTAVSFHACDMDARAFFL